MADRLRNLSKLFGTLGVSLAQRKKAMKSRSWSVLACLALVLPLAGSSVGARDLAPRPASLVEAQRSLSTLHLLRGLQLTVAQVESLQKLAEKAAEFRVQYLQDEQEKFAQFEGGIRDYMDRLIAGTAGDGLDDPVAAKVYAANSTERQRHNDWLAKFSRIEAQAADLLNEDQVRMVGKFTRCLIAPLYMADPERVGQVGDGSKWLAVLDEVRGLDQRTWEGQRADRVDNFLFGVQGEVGPLSGLRRERLAARCERVFEQARSLSNIMYRLRKYELANFLDLEEQERNHYKQLWEQEDQIVGGPGPVAHWLLSPEALALYPRISEALARGVKLGPAADLNQMVFCTIDEEGRKHCSTATLADLEVMP